MSVPMGLGLWKGYVELKSFGGILTRMDLRPTVETADGPVLRVWNEYSHSYPASGKGIVYRA